MVLTANPDVINEFGRVINLLAVELIAAAMAKAPIVAKHVLINFFICVVSFAKFM